MRAVRTSSGLPWPLRDRRRGLPRRRYAPRALLLGCLVAVAAGIGLGVAVVSGHRLGVLEQDTLSARFALRPTAHPHGITIVAIDDHSFALLAHRWPFPRSWDGQVLERLHRAGARAVFFDVQFTEPTTPSQDGALFSALGQTGGAVLATTETDGHGHSGVLGGDANLRQVNSEAAASNFRVGVGGLIDHVPYELGGLATPAVAIARRLGVRVPGPQRFGSPGADVDYPGPPGSVPSLSFADVLRGRFPAAAVRGKVIVIGATSPSLQDLHATPVSSTTLMSGPEVQADAIWTVLHGLPLRPPPGWIDVLIVALLAVPPPLIKLRRSAAAAIVAAAALAAADLVAAQLLFDAGTVVPVVGPLLGLATSTLTMLVWGHLLVTRELRATQVEIVHRLARAAESRDGETGRHLERMAFLCERLALAAGLRRSEARLIRRASELHDIGKIAIPDEVLLKTGAYGPRDRRIMSTHADSGARMLADSSTSLVQIAEVMARTHHERWDGTGYPHGLSGEEIPLPGRICGICDVFDALISRRRYKESWSLEETLAEIRRGSGSHFDPDLTAAFLQIAPGCYRELCERVDPDIDVDVIRAPDPSPLELVPASAAVTAAPSC